MRRLRAEGKVPAVLYGHGEASRNLVLDGKELEAVLKHSGHVVQLKGAVTESALIKEVQFDHVRFELLHVDLYRVDTSELVEVTLEVTLKGTAKGTLSGGVLNHLLHEVDIECPAVSIPERLELKIGDLEVGQSLRAKDLSLPQGAKLLVAPEQIVVQCVKLAETDGAGATGGAEPEVIGRKKEDGGAAKA
jgi:large subunit ribosomal protein L25